MKRLGIKITALVIGAALLLPLSLLAQDEKKEKDKEVKENKEVKEKKEVEQIIITRKGENKEKVIVEINGDKVTINGKPLEEYKDSDGNISVRKSKHGEWGDYEGLLFNNGLSKTLDWKGNDQFKMFGEDANRAMLGVTTDKKDEGVEIQTISKGSAAEKAGLKEKDIITKVNDKNIDEPDELSEVIQKHKPGEKVTVTYLRDKKESKVTAELGKYKGTNVFGTTVPGQNFKMEQMDLGDAFRPRVRTTPGTPAYRYSGGSPKLGLSVQDTDDGKGVKIIEVDDESNAAKAGMKNDDVVTEVDGKAVNGADEMAKIIRESKDKSSIMLKVQRGGKTQNIEVKIPKKLKTADL